VRRLRLKKNRYLNKVKLFIVTILLLVVSIGMLLTWLGNKISSKMLEYTEVEVTKLSKTIVNKAVDDTVIGELNMDNLFYVQKNDNNDIQVIDFDPKIVNIVLNSISDNIIKYFEELENGESSAIDIKKNIITNDNIVSDKKGIVFEIPIGVITNNAFLSNLGPRMPVRVSLNGELESSIKSKVESYGINNAMITVSVNIRVSEKILLPISSKKITIENDIPIAIKMIQGNIPNYYFDGIGNNSNLLTVPSS